MQIGYRRLILGGTAAAILSGLPSTGWALVVGDDPLAATRAAGTLLPGRRHRVLAGGVADVGISAFWTLVFGAVAERYDIGPVSGAVGGLVVATIDLGLVGRAFPAIAALPPGPQWADHLAFGALLGWALGRGQVRPATGADRPSRRKAVLSAS